LIVEIGAVPHSGSPFSVKKRVTAWVSARSLLRI
jgi:hypothetical protein